MSRAICLRCGAEKGTSASICPACGHRPEGDGLLVAWLLSDAHVDDAALDAIATRIRAGEPLRPSEPMLERARRALGRHAAQDPGLPASTRLALLATSIVLTPAVGLVCWASWRDRRPRSATQALWLSLPAGLLAFAAVSWRVLAGG